MGNKGLVTTIEVDEINILSLISILVTQDLGNYDTIKEELNKFNITEPMFDIAIESARKRIGV